MVGIIRLICVGVGVGAAVGIGLVEEGVLVFEVFVLCEALRAVVRPYGCFELRLKANEASRRGERRVSDGHDDVVVGGMRANEIGENQNENERTKKGEKRR